MSTGATSTEGRWIDAICAELDESKSKTVTLEWELFDHPVLVANRKKNALDVLMAVADQPVDWRKTKQLIDACAATGLTVTVRRIPTKNVESDEIEIVLLWNPRTPYPVCSQIRVSFPTDTQNHQYNLPFTLYSWTIGITGHSDERTLGIDRSQTSREEREAAVAKFAWDECGINDDDTLLFLKTVASIFPTRLNSREDFAKLKSAHPDCFGPTEPRPAPVASDDAMQSSPKKRKVASQ